MTQIHPSHVQSHRANHCDGAVTQLRIDINRPHRKSGGITIVEAVRFDGTREGLPADDMHPDIDSRD
jgi:hypothetical protein